MDIIEPIDDLLKLGVEFGVKFLAAVACGAVLGLEREASDKPAGLRTNILVCLGSMLFTVISFRMADSFGGDSTRVAAQIVSGIGFLGAGAIIQQRQGVRGMTTAAVIWLVAALGMVIGAGYPISAVGLAVLSVLLIVGLHALERAALRSKHPEFHFAFALSSDPGTYRRVVDLLNEESERVEHFRFERAKNGYHLRCKFAGGHERVRRIVAELTDIPGVDVVGKGHHKDSSDN